jgi:cob(I)alamin adenosyltransferase
MSIFTFSTKGDTGETSLIGGVRVSKASLRPELYGTLDEASSVLGLAKVFSQETTIRQIIEQVQDDLLVLGAELASERPETATSLLDVERTTRLERWIGELQREVPLPRHFVRPGTNAASAALDLARTIVRRAERRAVALGEAKAWIRPEVNAYLNRLADCLFTLARYAEKRA